MSEVKPAYIARANVAEALRSGKYKQIRRRLGSGNARCWYGVVRVVLGEDLLSFELYDKLDMSTEDMEHLVYLNDMGEKSFEQLATLMLECPYKSEQRDKSEFTGE